MRRRELTARADDRGCCPLPGDVAQVVAKIYAQALRLKLKGAPLLPPPRGEQAEGVRLAMRDQLARGAPSRTVLSRGSAAGRIDVVEGGRRRASARPTPTARDASPIHDPAAWRGPLRGSVGLGEAYVDGLWETDDLVALIRIARPRAARPRRPARRRRRPRGAPAPARGLVPANTRAARAGTSPPTTTSATTSSRLPRRAHDVLVRLLPERRAEPRGGAAGQARADLRRRSSSAPTTTCSRSAPAGAGSRPRRAASTAAG